MEAKAPSRKAPEEARFSWASPAAVAVLALLASGGASTSASGVSFGLPGLKGVVFAALATVLVRTSGVRGPAGFFLPVALLLIVPFAPSAFSSLLLFSGPPLLAFVFAGLCLAAAASGWRPPRAVLLPAFFAIYAAVSYGTQTRVGPGGDEPQYLMVAESLLRDQDLALDRDFEERRYEAFVAGPLEPHFRIRGPEGQIYSLHAVGLSLLILPAYALGGYAGASFFMALLAALLIVEIRKLVEALTGDESLAEGTAWLIGLSPPIIHFAGLIFTEIPAALLLCVGLRAAVFGRTPSRSLIAALCVGALPWLNVRYAILAVAVFGALAFRLWRSRVADGVSPVKELVKVVLLPAGSAMALGLYHFVLWGFFDPRRVYGRRREFSLAVLPEGLPGLFLDQEFGLLIYAPIFVLSLAGFVHLFKRQRALALASFFAAAGVIATASVWPMWRGGFNPPARFLVPLIPVLALGLALVLTRGVRASTALLAGWSLWCGLFGAMNIETIHRDRDGVAPFFRAHSGAREWTAALPSFVLTEDKPTRCLAWPWVILLAVPLVGALRRRQGGAREATPRQVVIGTTAFLAAAVVADQMTPRIRSPERGAVRGIGSLALVLPDLRFQPSHVAEWPLEFLYEPHRFPLGVTFARQVTLPAGQYELSLENVESHGDSPTLSVVDHRGRHPDGSHRLTDRNGASVVTFTIETPGEFDLSLRGGGPRSLKTATLRRLN